MAGSKSDENVRFLYLCVKNSRGNGQVDWLGVGNAMGLNIPAVRMRFKRLEDKIQATTEKSPETETDVKMTGTPDTDGPGEQLKEPKKETRATKRKRVVKGAEKGAEDV